MQPRAGFTLIEIAIVLVIIGLIAGSVLVGRDLIEAAKIRQQITQIERFKTAVQTFRTKYNGLPGDIDQADAAAFGFTPRAGTIGHGNGDGILEYCDGTVSANANLGCEYVLFWRDLSDANLIEGTFTTATDAPVTVTAGQANNLYVPDAKVGVRTSVTVFSIPAAVNVIADGGIHGGIVSCGVGSVCYAIAGIFNVTNGPYKVGWDATGQIEGGLTPLEAFAIDSKIDDGLPTSGSVYGASFLYSGMSNLVNFYQPDFCLSIVLPQPPVAPSFDTIQVVYATSSAVNPYSGDNSTPNLPTCLLNISGQ